VSKLGQSDPAWERIKYNFSVTPLAIEQAKAAVKELTQSWGVNYNGRGKGSSETESESEERSKETTSVQAAEKEIARLVENGIEPDVAKHWVEEIQK